MDHLVDFNRFSFLFEKITPITSNWFIVGDESSFDKKDQGGYLVFNQKGNFTVVYKKDDIEEARMDFYVSKESSPDKKSLCTLNIVTNEGKDRAKKFFDDVTFDNTLEILSAFFDYCDLEKASKEVIDKFLIGMSKSVKNVLKDDNADQLPASFKAFVTYLERISSGSIEDEKSENLELKDLVIKFLDIFSRKL
jgi:hypothetical protein